MQGTFTGRHMAAVMFTFFGVVIAVNIGMARLAGSTFGGEVVKNSYVASQKYNGWLREAAAEKALGWQLVAQRRDDDRVTVAVSGPSGSDRLTGVARHPLGAAPDVPLAFARTADGTFVSDRPLPEGRWFVRFDLESGGRKIQTEQELK
jgi:nitrogen fixation protein FixH